MAVDSMAVENIHHVLEKLRVDVGDFFHALDALVFEKTVPVLSPGQFPQRHPRAGNRDPLAYLELKSIGLPAQRTKEFSALLCDLVSRELDIPPDRVYIEFSDAPRAMWGWNGGTFEG
jgi:phenylpyruvate tautomerase PptA (4-oxalocrotonate tautomerase family)